jgi:sugar/nucleoside kinase (ribokinase family)
MCGGNTGNSLVALSRLGVACKISTKVGKDTYGKAIIDDFKAEGIDCTTIVEKPGVTTAFVYIIVCEKSKTRTCIHSPSNEEYLPEDFDEIQLDGIQLVHLDGRNSNAAMKAAALASARGIPIVLDAEKERPGQRELLTIVNFVITNPTFLSSQESFSSSKGADGISMKMDDGDNETFLLKTKMSELLLQYPNLQWVITTRGPHGSIMMFQKGNFLPHSPSLKACAGSASSGISLVDPILDIRHSTFHEKEFDVLTCPAVFVHPDKIVDSTGAGDTFIAGVLYGIIKKLDPIRFLSLASHMASIKLRQLGARQGMPFPSQLPSGLLNSTM